MLWTAVWSVYLGIVEWVGMSVIGMGLTIYLATLLVIRFIWGCERGLRITVSLTTGFAFVYIGVCLPRDAWDDPVVYQHIIVVPLGCFIGYLWASGVLSVCASWSMPWIG